MSADGKQVTVCVKLSEPEAARLDQVRGKTPRTAWARAAVLAALEPGGTPGPQRKSAPKRRPASRRRVLVPESASDIMAHLRKRGLV